MRATRSDESARAAHYTVDGTPQVGDIAQWNTGFYGHVAYVYAVNNGVASIAEYNHLEDGRYLNSSMTNGRTVATNGANFIHMGKPASSGSVTVTPSGRLAFINSNNAPYAKDNISTGGWHPLLGSTDSASYISAADTHLALINSAGDAWGGDVSSTNLNSNSPGFVPLNVPKDSTRPGGIKKIVTDKDGNMIAINNCNRAYGWRNIPGGQQWVSMSSCDDAVDVDVGSGRFGFRNSCGGGYISDSGYAWTEARPCGDAKAIAIGETGRIMIINSANTAYL